MLIAIAAAAGLALFLFLFLRYERTIANKPWEIFSVVIFLGAGTIVVMLIVVALGHS